jgi:hypothetical protein
VAGGLVGTAALTGCSAQDLTTRKVVDPEAGDRARLEQARDLSVKLRADIGSGDPRMARLADLHTQQIEEFTRSGGLGAPKVTAAAMPLTSKSLPAHERALAQSFRALALQATRGDVAALLASAAAGIDQALAR